jgi:hypothetical protein
MTRDRRATNFVPQVTPQDGITDLGVRTRGSRVAFAASRFRALHTRRGKPRELRRGSRALISRPDILNKRANEIGNLRRAAEFLNSIEYHGRFSPEFHPFTAANYKRPGRGGGGRGGGGALA